MQLLLVNFSKPPVSHLDKIAVPIYRNLKTVSRLNYKPDVLPFALKSEPISEVVLLSKKGGFTFAECCEKRIAQLEKVKGNIFLMWSGGIDSTVAITAIMKYGSETLKSKVRIVLSTESYYEFPEMFRMLCGKFPFVNTYYPPEAYLQQDDVLISGELGDQIFGSDFIYTTARYLGDSAVFKDYEKTVPKLFMSLAGDQQGQEFYDHLSPITKEAPFPIKTAFDFFWWWNFSQKWQYVKFRILYGKFSEAGPFQNSVLPFFDTPEFQVWSLLNHEKKISGDLVSYKFTAKDFIIDYTKLGHYGTKPKIGSLKKVRFLPQLKYGMFEDYSIVRAKHIQNYIEKGTFF